jgi:predicted acylesterase/phospholipase RssA
MQQGEYCDIVMKGGITSGIVYPNAVLALSRRYRFKNIGGTSAGAIAAAALAAAALGERRRTGSDGKGGATGGSLGFQGLENVAGLLKKPGFILGLFQPVQGAGPAFHLLLAMTRQPSLLRKISAAVRAIILLAPAITLSAAALLLVLAWLSGGWPAAAVMAIPSLVLALVLGAIAGLNHLGARIRDNSLGICSGRAVPHRGGRGDGLTDWLHGIVQSLSGTLDRPLLFKDLWEAPAYPDEPGARRLSLEMITTSISHQEPRRLPFENSRFWFRKDQFERLFPDEVVTWMMEQDSAPLEIGGSTFHLLPEGGELPVIVATRMSLSFPLLLSAVPLYEGVWTSSAGSVPSTAETGGVNRTLTEASDALAVGGRRESRRPADVRLCWFSDGGIGSNFPIHLFDSPLPRWPTFAIDLVYPHSGDTSSRPDVFLPTENNQGWQHRYSSIAAPGAIAEIGSFLFGIVATMQNWRDTLQARAPGHRDRIVSIALGGDEGGMNLDMSEAVLDRISEKGSRAGQALAEQFDFGNHWWIRWRNAASALERFTIRFAAASSAPPSPSYADVSSSARTGSPAPPSYAFRGAQREEAVSRFNRLEQDGQLWEDTVADLTRGAPKPLPELRIVPTF